MAMEAIPLIQFRFQCGVHQYDVLGVNEKEALKTFINDYYGLLIRSEKEIRLLGPVKDIRQKIAAPLVSKYVFPASEVEDLIAAVEFASGKSNTNISAITERILVSASKNGIGLLEAADKIFKGK